MQRILITGMSGTGKSTLIGELAQRGYDAVDTDSTDWCVWVYSRADDLPPGVRPGQEWIWREEKIQALLEDSDRDVLFVSGCVSNQGRFYPLFDHIVLLSAPTEVIIERLRTRTNNDYGKDPEELADVLHHIATVEPLLRRGATLEIDTRAPLDEVVHTLIGLVQL